jgi:hypothetical protein
VTDKNPNSSRPDQAASADQAVADAPSPSVSAFVAAAINEHRRSHGLSQLLADMAAVDGEPAEDDRTWAQAALEVS